jgi:predicted RNA binding protein YcfA (HicA-like mRNA interferase family)
MSFQRRKSLRYLLDRGCRIVRESGEHTIVADPEGRTTAVSRHRDVNRNTTRRIAKDLEIDVELFVREVR